MRGEREDIMNKVILSGRMTRDAEVRYSTGDNPIAIARFTLAVEKRFKRDGESDADFINCVAFGNSAKFVERFGTKGKKFELCGHLSTGSYTDKDGKKVYTTDVDVEDISFAEGKKEQ